MRINEEYRRAGYFWLPDAPERVIPGNLTISDGGLIELEVIGLFDDSTRPLNGEADIGRIVGHIEKDGPVTLDNCFYRKKSIPFGAISKSIIHVNMVLSGFTYNKDKPLRFNAVSFSIEGLDEWLGISGIDVRYDDDYHTATISYVPQPEILYELKKGFKLHIFFKYTLPGFPHITEARITQKAYFKLSSKDERDISDFIDIIHKITFLLCFAVDATVAVRNISAISDANMINFPEQKAETIPIKIYYPSVPFSGEMPKISLNTMVFRYGQIRENAESIINNWLEAYTVIDPALGLYFSAVTSSHTYLEGRFLALAQALETYHRRTSHETLMEKNRFRPLLALLLRMCPKVNRRWLYGRLIHGNEISLGTRIKKIIEPFKGHIGNSNQRNRLIRTIVNTRNYLTHYSESLEAEAAHGMELWELCKKMEAIFQLYLLRQLGFSNDEIITIINGNYKLKSKMS
ncbi:HEPN domain-containing protein [Acidithiobacillus sp. AMEEHan]|uniref:ApeA N-terminal domain 1-containing protein n=1 Tax=Acidithiobacillus sp. AMEEHan TaxID=2994951 RepID=UPI0027E3B5D7|nr:HEPN domain-containing protein [Acidithiobacillus sp. AMEEHan]